MKLLRTCKEATHLVLQAQDEALPLSDRLALQVHLLICKTCPVFVKQVELMRRAGAQWRRYIDR